MCGIIASSSASNLNINDVRLGMLMADDRGGHSTGFTDGYKLYKTVDDAKGFFKRNGGDTIDVPKEMKSFIGHTRWATAGDKSIPNTHPFNFSNALGVHNGAIDNFKELKKEYGQDAVEYIRDNFKGYDDLEDITSDSMLLYYMIQTQGLKKAIQQTKGTMALVYYDKEKNLHVYRYDKPLCYGFKGDELWIGSYKRYLKSLGCHKIRPFTQHAEFVINAGNVIDHKQLKHKYAPSLKDKSHSEDLDPLFTEEHQKKGWPEKERKNESSDSSKIIQTNKDQLNFEKDEFKAPAYAQCSVADQTDQLILWWFSETNEDIVYVEVEGHSDILSYDLNEEEYVFKSDMKEIKDDVLDMYSELKLASDLRQENKSYVIQE